MRASDFGEEFHWGTATAAYQIEGAHDKDGKGSSIWDDFTNSGAGRIIKNQNANEACNHYHLFEDDVQLIKHLNIPNYRFSVSWSRIFPEGTGQINRKGVDFYHRLIDACLSRGIEPWLTMYHWDLPAALERKGGWTNRDVLGWFEEYATFLLKEYGSKVKRWMVLNEPMVFTGAGYFLGVHAPGKKGLKNFLPAMHHAALSQSLGGRLVKSNCPDAEVGTTYSCSYITPFSGKRRHLKAANRVDALLNRLFIEPVLGLGYPVDTLTPLQRVYDHFKPNDEKELVFDFDFVGVQNYTREVVKHVLNVPLIWAKFVEADKRKVPSTTMNWEVYPECIYEMIRRFASYDKVKKVIVTENGAAFKDELVNGCISDIERKSYLEKHIAQVLRAKKEGYNVGGYFIWTFLDNFEWAEGYEQRFGIVYTDYKSQDRIVKNSGMWYADFLKGYHS